MTALPHPVAAGPQTTHGEWDSFVEAVAQANGFLNGQRDFLTALGLSVDDKGLAAQTAHHLSGVLERSGDHRMRLLQLSLSEMGARQSQILDAVRKVKSQEFEGITLDAFVHAMHRIRTCLDLALGCSEEIAEISGNKDAVRAAREAAMAVRLVYHYTNELNDLASFNAEAALQECAEIDCGAALQRAVAGLAPIAEDLGVSLRAQPCPGLVTVGPEKILMRTLTYLILTNIVAPGVKNVVCSLDVIDQDAAAQVRFLITEDGRGLTLEERIASGTCRTMLGGDSAGNAQDATGFAIVRRLARMLGGRIVIELVKGHGSQMVFTMPQGKSQPD